MSAGVDMHRIEGQVLRETQQDGLMELVMGLCLAAFSLRALHPAFVGMFALGALLFRPVLTALRRRYTYPRIGYAQLREDNPKEVLSGITAIILILLAVLAVGFLLFGDVRDFGLWLKWSPAFPGTLLGAMFFSFASKSQIARHYVFAVVSVASGLGLSILRFDPPEQGLFIYCLVMGVVLIVWGLAVFVRFLRGHPLPAEEVPDVHG